MGNFPEFDEVILYTLPLCGFTKAGKSLLQNHQFPLPVEPKYITVANLKKVVIVEYMRRDSVVTNVEDPTVLKLSSLREFMNAHVVQRRAAGETSKKFDETQILKSIIEKGWSFFY